MSSYKNEKPGRGLERNKGEQVFNTLLLLRRRHFDISECLQRRNVVKG
jgi:hypothetical protein